MSTNQGERDPLYGVGRIAKGFADNAAAAQQRQDAAAASERQAVATQAGELAARQAAQVEALKDATRRAFLAHEGLTDADWEAAWPTIRTRLLTEAGRRTPAPAAADVAPGVPRLSRAFAQSQKGEAP